MTRYPTGGTASETRRLRRHLNARPTLFTDVPETAGALLELIDEAAGPGTLTVYLVGPSPGSWLTWALADLPAGCEPGGHYLDATAPVLRYSLPGGRRCEIHRAAQWFGVGPYTIAEAGAAWGMLGAAVARIWPGGILLATPATTGRELFRRDIPEHRSFEVLDADTQDLIRATDGQGRIETLPPPSFKVDGIDNYLADLPALFEYDATFAYAALCWGLPQGRPTLDRGDDYLGHQAARYLIRGRVPRDWHERFGLFGVQRDDGSQLWAYPATPGEEFETWVDGAELHVAHQHAPTWADEIRIVERLVWPPHEGKGKGPLDTWADKIKRCRADLQRAAEHHPRIASLAANGARALLLHGVGSFHGRPRALTHFAPVDDKVTRVPPNAKNVRLEGDWLIWQTDAAPPEPGSWRWQLSHPEWAAKIWARCRARLLAAPLATGALYRTAGEVVAFRTDAVYMTARQEWPDDQRVGHFRLKRAVDGPLPWPMNARELLELRDGILP